MSHLSVMVRLPSSVRMQGIEKALKEILAPYAEQDAEEKYLTFRDDEEEHVEKYKTESASMIRLADGSVHSKYDDRFRNPELFGSPQYLMPAGAAEFKQPVMERYATFEQYMAEYCGYKDRDPKTGRYGRWRNENANWDYWRIGGRWRAKLPVTMSDENGYGEVSYEWQYSKTGTPRGKDFADFCRIGHIDFGVVEAKTTTRIDEFWKEWCEFIEGKKFDGFDGPREKALSLGLIECKDGIELTGKEWRTEKWSGDRDRYDVIKPTTREWLEERRELFCSISTWARLDESGWKEWGMSDATPDTEKSHAIGLLPWLKSGNQRDWVVIVDCHI